MRVGDYKTDSSGGRGDGALEMAALDDDPIAIRSALWTATDQAYKTALCCLRAKAGRAEAGRKRLRRPTTSARRSPSSRSPILIAFTSTERPGTIALRTTAALYRTDPSVSAAPREIEYNYR